MKTIANSEIGQSGRALLFPGVSCVTFDPRDGASPNYDRVNYFDVPDQSYGDGNLTGIKAACELLLDCKRTNDGSLIIKVVCEAEKIADAADPTVTDAFDRRGAAIGLLATMEELFCSALQNFDIAAFAKERLMRHEQSMQNDLDDVRKKNKNFVATFEAELKAVGA